MDGLQTGLLASDIHILDPKKFRSTGSGSAGFAMGSWSENKRSRPSKDGVDLGLYRRLGTQETLDTIVMIDQSEQVNHRPDVRDEIESISERGAENAIKKTTVIAQQYETRPDQSIGSGRKREKSKDYIEMFVVR